MLKFPISLSGGLAALFVTLVLAACAPEAPPAFRATVAPNATAPVYTATPTRTPTFTPTLTPTLTLTPSPTASATPTLSPTPTASATPTVPLLTLTPPSDEDAPDARRPRAFDLAPTEGWSCGDFPCEDDVEGFLRRIRVPEGFLVRHVGRFPGQPQQIAYGGDGRLYATVLEDGTRSGAVYVMNADGSAERYVGDFVSPIGLAFQPGTDVLYVSARVTPESGGVLYRIPPGGAPEVVRDDLPCCFSIVDNQPNGMVFGPDGYLYLGVGSVTDRAEPADPAHQQFATLEPLEAAVLRIQPHTGEIEPYARGLRNPFDVTFDSAGTFYASDQGLVTGEGDRVLALAQGGHYGFPFWRARGCAECPFTPPGLEVLPDLVQLPIYAIPRGLVAYTATAFPQNYYDTLFVTLWNAIEGGQRVVHIDPRLVPTDPEGRADYVPEPFVTGLIRPIDVALTPDGALVVADFIYGHIWRIDYVGS